MGYYNTGVNEYYIGMPSEEEKEKLEREGYTLMSQGETEETKEKYQIWIR